MAATVSMRARRTLGRLTRFRSVGHSDGIPLDTLGEGLLGHGEMTIGVYENVPGSFEQCIVVTNRGLHVNTNLGWLTLPYENMVGVDVGNGEKSCDRDFLEIPLRTGAKALILVSGRDPSLGTCDKFSMAMFLDHVMGDLRRQQESGANRGT